MERERGTKTRFGVVRAPLLVWLGAGELTVSAVGDTVAKAWAQVGGARSRAAATYAELADRGESTLRRVREQPRVAHLLRNMAYASDRLDHRVEFVVDEMHDASEEALGRVSLETWAVGERAARATQRLARRITE